MNPFTYQRSASVDDALRFQSHHPHAKYIGGGTNLIDLMKTGVERPEALIDITPGPSSSIEQQGTGLRIGAMAKNSAVAANLLVRQRYPVLAQALLAGASPQIRNMATVGGNLLQRTRCYYFYDPSYQQCNKRVPGSGCAAIDGQNRLHSIVGGSDQCIAAHPSDMAVALAALGARLHVRGHDRERIISMGELHRLPGATPHIETSLLPGDLITAIDLPEPIAGKSHYLKVRDRDSYAFALVSVAAIIDIDHQHRVRQARLALGGIAPKPWRMPEAEQALIGEPITEASARRASEILLRGAKGYRSNAFKIERAHRSLMRAISIASGIA